MVGSPPKVALSLEPVYKDDLGNSIPKLYDISRDDNIIHTYQPPHDPAKKLRQSLAQLVYERGDLATITVKDILQNPIDGREKPQKVPENPKEPVFTAVELAEMRQQVNNALNSAGSDIQSALDLINILLTTVDPDLDVPAPEYVHSSITTTTAPASAQARPAALPSVQALKAQIIIGTKNETLQNAAEVFKAASGRTAAIIQRSEKYWENALRLRRSNWPLIPAPLRESLAGQVVIKSMDPSAKDFWVSYGLENAPGQLRRQAVASLADELDSKSKSTQGLLEYPFSRSHKQLRVSVTTIASDGQRHTGSNNFALRSQAEGSDQIQQEIYSAQQESVEQELYRELITEAASLPSAAARASETMIVIEAARDIELTFEMTDTPGLDGGARSGPTGAKNDVIASLIRHALVLLLLRSHRVRQSTRQQKTSSLAPYTQMAGAPIPNAPPPLLLAPIISILQYHSFVQRLWGSFNDIKKELESVGVSCYVRTIGVSDEIAQVLLKGKILGEEVASTVTIPGAGASSTMSQTLMDREDAIKVGGESSLRIGGRHVIRFTYSSPVTVSLHLPQATIPINDATQLHQFLVAEVCKCILERLKEVGAAAEEDHASLKPTKKGAPGESVSRWLVDGLEGTLVGDWKGGRIQLKVMLTERYKLSAVAVKSGGIVNDRMLSQQITHRYPPRSENNGATGEPSAAAPTLTLEEWLKELL